MPREIRVMKIYKEIQSIRRSGDVNEMTSHAPDSNNDDFLLMNYELPDLNIVHRRTHADLKNFLYNSVDYELCTKVKGVKSNWNEPTPLSYRRRGRALGVLRGRMHNHPTVENDIRHNNVM